MGLQIRTYVNGNQEFIELYGNETIDMEVSFAEIQDITKKNSAFTKEFKVPGTKNNNYIFNYFFDINSVYLDWNPKKKFQADLLYDGYELYNGYVRMNSVDVNKIEKIYSITFYSAVGDLVANIGDKGMCDLDTSQVNYYTSALTENLFWLNDPDFQPKSVLIEWSGGTSWNGLTNADPLTNGDVNLMLAQRGYDYTGSTFNSINDIDTFNTPVLNFSGAVGFFDYWNSLTNAQQAVNLAYLVPSIRIRKMYEMICEEAGYYIESEFFDTSYFGRYYLPCAFNTDSVYLNQSKKYLLSFENLSATTGSNQSVTYELRNISFDGGAVNNELVIFPIDITEENLGYNPFPPAAEIDNQNQLVFRLPIGSYQFEIDATVVYTGASSGSPLLEPLGNAIVGFTTFLDSTTFSAESQVTFAFLGQNTNTGDEYQNVFTSSTVNSVGYYGEYDYAVLVLPRGISYDYYYKSVKFKVIGQSQSLPPLVELNKEMSCEIKQIDFISDVNRMFNLVVIEHPLKPDTLIIEPMINYIGKGETLDWTEKVDFNSNLKLTPTSSIINGSLFFANKIDKDYINQEYNKKSNLVFGQNIYNLGEDFKNNQINLAQKTLAQNTDYYLNASGTTNIALPCYFITKQNNNNGISSFEFRPFRSLPRVTFLGFPLNNNQVGQNSWWIRFGGDAYPVASYQNYNRFTTYPSALTGFSHYTIYDSRDVFTDDELIYPEADNMYDVFYRDYIEDLIAPENKILNCKMYLTPWEVSNLYFNEKITIKNANWRINKISGLSLLEPGLCDVELVKLTREYTSFPIKFYDLIPCDCSLPVLHTHTDLTYHIYAFEGYYMEVARPPYNYSSTGFSNIEQYLVVETQFNPNYDYEKIYFRSGLTNAFSAEQGLYPYFSHLQCENNITSTYTGFTQPYDQFTTGNTLTDCVSLQVTNTGASATTFYFVDCSGTTSSWTLQPSSAITICVDYYEGITGDTIVWCAGSNNCNNSTPLPTPTPTVTPGLSPTPTQTVTPSPATPTPTPTPSSTPNPECEENTPLNVTKTGYIKYELCDGTLKYYYINTTGLNILIPDCIRVGTILPGFPYADIATYTESGIGTPC